MRNIVLVGFMGTGKTVTGRALAAKLGRKFLELDEIIENKEGISVKEIFERKGEPYFRKIEREVVKESAERDGVVISAGGGVIIDEKNLENLKKNALIVCLEASPDVILDRTKGLGNRPLLNVHDPGKRIKELLEKRAHYYKKADFSVHTDGLSAEEVADKIIRWMTERD
ncbi:MAG: shikimate kinase [Candidatus Omnitrophica bacterium]|nr:shikimate kinase [Candidatus Omnitrophota bacterium]